MTEHVSESAGENVTVIAIATALKREGAVVLHVPHLMEIDLEHEAEAPIGDGLVLEETIDAPNLDHVPVPDQDHPLTWIKNEPVLAVNWRRSRICSSNKKNKR